MEKSYRTNLRKRRKLMFVERFGGKCQFCGYNKCINALAFHHLDKSKKKYNPTKIIDEGSVERAEKELEKCILLCMNCHSEVHSEDYNFDFANFERFIMKWYDKPCEFCKNKFKTKVSEQKFCCHKCSELSQRRVKNRPTKNELSELIQKYSWVDLGSLFSVSDNAVRKWAKGYALI